jgi:hypothetical protein
VPPAACLVLVDLLLLTVEMRGQLWRRLTKRIACSHLSICISNTAFRLDLGLF